MQGYKLAEGQYKTDKLTTDKMWDTFNWLFSAYSRNDTSYKFIFLKAIIDCLDKKDAKGRISFDTLFQEYTKLSWNLVLKYGLAQKSAARDGRKSTLENVLRAKYDGESDFNELFEDEKKVICHEVKMQCKKYVVGALYGDTDGYIYSFSKKDEWIEVNPVMEKFIKENEALIENLNYYKWAKFYENTNGPEKERELMEKFSFDMARKNETVYRSILAKEFEVTTSEAKPRTNTFELLMVADQISQEDELDETLAEDKFYKDLSSMKEYMDNPIMLLQQIKKEKKYI